MTAQCAKNEGIMVSAPSFYARSGRRGSRPIGILLPRVRPRFPLISATVRISCTSHKYQGSLLGKIPCSSSTSRRPLVLLPSDAKRSCLSTPYESLLSPSSLVAMGRRNVGKRAAAGDKAESSKTTRSAEWKKSKCTAPMLTSLVREGLLGSKESKTWRLPGSESVPSPATDERIAFVDFVPRGVSFPLHPFFLAVLCAYGIQLHDLTPNSVQHMACFIVLCECYFGIAPHWALFKRIFRVKA